MAILIDPNVPYFRLRLAGLEESFPALQDVSNFLYDYNILYEGLRLALDPIYSDFVFSQYAYFTLVQISVSLCLCLTDTAKREIEKAESLIS